MKGLVPEVPPEVVTDTFCGPVGAPGAITKLAVMEVALFTVTPVAVIPVPLKLMVVAPVWKFVPVSVSLTVVPCAPMTALSEVSVGAGGLTVKATALVVTPREVMLTFCMPSVALAAITKLAVIEVGLATVTLFAVIPVPPNEMVAGAKKFVPVRVTGTVEPSSPLLGEMEASVAGASTVNVAAFEVPPEVITVMLDVPVAATAEITSCVVMLVVLTTFVFWTVTPALLI